MKTIEVKKKHCGTLEISSELAFSISDSQKEYLEFQEEANRQIVNHFGIFLKE